MPPDGAASMPQGVRPGAHLRQPTGAGMPTLTSTNHHYLATAASHCCPIKISVGGDERLCRKPGCRLQGVDILGVAAQQLSLLVQQAQDLEPRLFLDFFSVVQ